MFLNDLVIESVCFPKGKIHSFLGQPSAYRTFDCVEEGRSLTMAEFVEEPLVAFEKASVEKFFQDNTFHEQRFERIYLAYYNNMNQLKNDDHVGAAIFSIEVWGLGETLAWEV